MYKSVCMLVCLPRTEGERKSSQRLLVRIEQASLLPYIKYVHLCLHIFSHLHLQSIKKRGTA